MQSDTRGWWGDSGASKLLQGSDFTCCCFSSVWHHVMALYTQIAAWKQMLSPLKCLLNLVTFHWLQDQHHEDVLMIQIYWLHNADLFTMINAQSFQWPTGFYHVRIVRIVLIWICMTISPPYRVDDEAQQERQRLQIKVHYTKSTMIIFLNFLHDAFLMVLLISLYLLCSLGRIHSIVCDHREMKPDLTMEWRRLTRHLLRVRISSQFILKLIFVHSREYCTL